LGWRSWERGRPENRANDGATARKSQCCNQERKKELSMTKTWNLIQETVRNSKHPFRQSENRPPKKKNRYERRKVREFLRLGDWAGELEAEA
jgi:hypothetical protein